MSASRLDSSHLCSVERDVQYRSWSRPRLEWDKAHQCQIVRPTEKRRLTAPDLDVQRGLDKLPVDG